MLQAVIMSQVQTDSPRAKAAVDYEKQSEKLSLETHLTGTDNVANGIAVEAKFITPLDPVIQTADGGRLPAVPMDEAHKINLYKDKADGNRLPRDVLTRPRGLSRFDQPEQQKSQNADRHEGEQDGDSRNLGDALLPSRTHPLFPPLPLYGPPSLLRSIQCTLFRFTSFVGSSCFLAVIVLGAAFTSIPLIFTYIWLRLAFRDPDARRPFSELEKKRKVQRREVER